MENNLPNLITYVYILVNCQSVIILISFSCIYSKARASTSKKRASSSRSVTTTSTTTTRVGFKEYLKGKQSSEPQRYLNLYFKFKDCEFISFK